MNNEIIHVYPYANGIICYEMPSPTVSASITPTSTESPTHSITDTHTSTSSVSITPTITETITSTSSVSTTYTQTITPTITETITTTQTLTITQTQTYTYTITETQTPPPTFTITPTPTITPGMFYLNLIANFPNPFKTGTNIVYELGRNADIVVKVFTISGEKVIELNEMGMQGRNSIYWNGRNESSQEAASGIYLYKIEAQADENRAEEWGKCAIVR